MWFDKLWQNTVDFFRTLDIPVRTLECCSGDLADLKVKSLDVEAWSPRQKKYFEVGSCSNLGDAQARRLQIRVKDSKGNKYLAHTLNNTCVAPPRMLIAFLENNLREDGTVAIPEPLETEPPVAAPGIPVSVAVLRILLPVLAAALIIVLLCFLFRRHRKNEPEAEKKEEE